MSIPSKKPSVIGACVAIIAALSAVVWAATMDTKPPQAKAYAAYDKDGNRLADYVVPSDLEIDKEPNAEQIRYGQRLLNDSKRLMPEYVGSNMNCNSCHVAQGKKPMGAPYINTYNQAPQMNPRAERVFTIEDRINGCMLRSMNGKELPDDSAQMQAMVAYMKWLAQDVPHGGKVDIKNSWPMDMSVKPDKARGKKLYAQNCASCHGSDGEGKSDSRGQIVFPPLWGDESFNIGAGMARTYKAASFIRNNMPMGVCDHGTWGEGQEGTMSYQDAVDIAEYFTHQPRPDFPAKIHDWPSGNKPKDARY